jgi:hypothetical protein
VELLRLDVQILGLLPEPQLCDLSRADLTQVSREHLDLPVAQGGVQDPTRLASEALRCPLVSVREERNDRVQQRW